MNRYDYHPKRIVCLTEETTETLYLLGEEKRIVGISGFTVRPQKARKEKPKVSTFLEANIEKIMALKPDLVIGFSDIQAKIAHELIKKGITVWINNYRNIEGIINMMMQLGSLVGKHDKAQSWIEHTHKHIERIKQKVSKRTTKPRVYFEEWDNPLITSIEWVSELITLAGGINIFPQKHTQSLAKNRIIEDSNDVIKANPDIILASWCGKKFRKDKLLSRNGWHTINAIKKNDIYDIDSSIILQPGPAALTEGLQIIYDIINTWIKKNHHA